VLLHDLLHLVLHVVKRNVKIIVKKHVKKHVKSSVGPRNVSTSSGVYFSMASRRDFIKATAALSGTLFLGSRDLLGQLEPGQPSGLDILVLGGTGFIGPHLVRHAVSRGHRVTIFTRGRRDGDLPSSVVRLVGDRNGQLGALEGKKWDAVIDDSATNPGWVKQSTQLLKGSVGTYLFTSSTGVYYPYLERGLDENDPVHYDLVDPKDGSESFGVSKANCEREVLEGFGDKGMVIRPTYIVGPGDTTDRFPYWPVRFAKGGEILAPGRRDDPVQFIDVRDLAAFMIKIVESGKGGVFNASGPKSVMTAPQFYEVARATLRPDAKLTFVDDYPFLEAHKIVEAVPWALLKGNDYGMMSIRNDRAVAAGLTLRPVAETLRDTLAWWPTVPEARRARPRFAITPDQEQKALAAWHAR
jgi:2'-hydroxyisoflavone reductase